MLKSKFWDIVLEYLGWGIVVVFGVLVISLIDIIFDFILIVG